MSRSRAKVEVPTATGKKADYVLPKPRRKTGRLLVSAPRGGPPRYREAEAAQAIGARALALLECQERLLGELRDSLGVLETDLGEATRAQLHGRVRAAQSVLEWCEAVQQDLQQESRWAARGLQPIDLASLCRDLAGGAARDGVTVHLTGASVRPWWGDAALLGEVLDAALAVVGARASAGAAIVLELREDGGRTGLCIKSLGEPRDGIDPALVERFRRAVDRLGAAVTPDELGPGGAGLVLRLPHPAA